MPDQFPAAVTTVMERDGLKVHTMTAPDPFLANSTHVLETQSALIVVDGQFVAPYAKAFRDYVDRLGKPVERLYLSHAHVDHWFGLSTAFSDISVRASAQTIDALRRDGEAERAERAAQYGPMVPERVVAPHDIVVPGVDTVDGVKLELDVINDAECDAQLVITLPDYAITVAQDLVYSGTHVYVTAAVAHTMSLLRTMSASASDVFLAGHGPVADKAELEANLEYLTYAQERMAARDPIAFRAGLLTKYADRRCPELLDIFVPRLFKELESS